MREPPGGRLETPSASPATPSPPPEPPPPLDLGVTDSYDRDVVFSEISADGIKRYNAYYSWRDLEPQAGAYAFRELDEAISEATSAGIKVALEIEITDVGCTDPDDSDAKCIRGHLPRDLSFSRTSSRLDEERFVARLSNLVATIMKRYDPRVLTHVYAGNEVDSYLAVVLESSGEKRDLFPSFLALAGKVQEAVHGLPQPRPKFGTAFKFSASSTDFHEQSRRMSRVVDVMGFTIYPTDPDWGDSAPLRGRVPTWLSKAVEVVEGRPAAVTEIGASATAPFGDPGTQEEFARYAIDYLRQNRTAFQYATWFSLYDNPALAGEFFEGAGLKTIEGTKRPAYDVWAWQGR